MAPIPGIFLISAFLLSCLYLEAAAGVLPAHVPVDPSGVTTISSPGDVQIRYKEPGICETTPGVRSYSGYVDLDADTHIFFWFFEARHNASSAPITLWLTGGPGDDSLLAMFLENGPCSLTGRNLTTLVNPYSWNNVSNMLYLSQPIGVGFSYSTEGIGWMDDWSGDVYPPNVTSLPFTGGFGRWPLINASAVDTTELAAIAAYHTIQGLFSSLPQFDSEVQSRSFNLWTESYGGHYGPVFYDYFYEQNQAIVNGSVEGVILDFDSLGIGNGLIDYPTQAPFYPTFATENTYGLQTINKTVQDYMKFALNMEFGCLDQIINYCRPFIAVGPPETQSIKAICQEAADMCNDNVLGPWESYSTSQCIYDIRAVGDKCGVSEKLMQEYLNQGFVQDALGVNLNYTYVNNAVFYAFQSSGDWVFHNAFEALESLLEKGVRVALYYGDADYIANWFGGEAVSLAVKYIHADQFRAAGYQPFVVDGTEYGAVRQYGNFSFLRVYDSGHMVPFYQPLAALSMFQRTIDGLDVATGTIEISDSYGTNGTAHAIYTEASGAKPTSK